MVASGTLWLTPRYGIALARGSLALVGLMFGLLLIALQTAAPLTDPASWSSSSDYPAAALRGGDEGDVEFELHIERSGGVTDCKIIKSSGSASLDAATCPHLIKVARFNPSDVSGEPVRRYQGKLSWRIGADSPARQITIVLNTLPAALTGVHTDLAFTVTTSGRVTDCRIVGSSGSSDLDRRACSELIEKGRFNPVATPVTNETIRVNWQAR